MQSTFNSKEIHFYDLNILILMKSSIGEHFLC